MTTTTLAATLATTSHRTSRCTCPRRVADLVQINVADELVRLYKQGAAMARLAELSGLTPHTVRNVLEDREVSIRRSDGRRAPAVTTNFPFPPRGGVPAYAATAHRPECPASSQNRAHNPAEPARRGLELTHAVIVIGLIFAAEPGAEMSVRQISRLAGFELQWVHRVLQRMATNGWLSNRHQRGGRREGPRLFYKPTPSGLTALRDICELAQGHDIYQQWLPATSPQQPNVPPALPPSSDASGDSGGVFGVVSDEGPDNDPNDNPGSRNEHADDTEKDRGHLRQGHLRRGHREPMPPTAPRPTPRARTGFPRSRR